MPDVTPQTHHQILSAVRDVRNQVSVLRNSTNPPNGYMGFDLAESLLAELHEAISTKSRDRDMISGWLKTAIRQLRLIGGGAVSPVLDQAQQMFQVMWEELDAPTGR